MLGASWTNRDGDTRPLRETNFMVVAPYNAQVRRLREALRAAGLAGVPVGNVDKFQGREAPVVFYSMATSSAEDVPRSLQFRCGWKQVLTIDEGEVLSTRRRD